MGNIIHWQILWNVCFPIYVPALAMMTLFSAVGRWSAGFGFYRLGTLGGGQETFSETRLES